MICPVAPVTIVEVAGVRVMVVRTGMKGGAGGFTVTIVVPLTTPEVAVIIPVPAETPVIRPEVSMVTTPGLSEVQVIVGVGVIAVPL